MTTTFEKPFHNVLFSFSRVCTPRPIKLPTPSPREKGENHRTISSPTTRPHLPQLNAQISHAHPQILHLGETVHLFQPPDEPGGSWEDMEAVTWAIEQIPDGQVHKSGDLQQWP